MKLCTALKPMHPGELLREDILPAGRITQTELAERLGVSRLTISELVNEKRGLSADMAHRLARYFGNSPGFWLNLQKEVDLWDALQANEKAYICIKPRTAAPRRRTA